MEGSLGKEAQERVERGAEEGGRRWERGEKQALTGGCKASAREDCPADADCTASDDI